VSCARERGITGSQNNRFGKRRISHTIRRTSMLREWHSNRDIRRGPSRRAPRPRARMPGRDTRSSASIPKPFEWPRYRWCSQPRHPRNRNLVATGNELHGRQKHRRVSRGEQLLGIGACAAGPSNSRGLVSWTFRAPSARPPWPSSRPPVCLGSGLIEYLFNRHDRSC